MNKKYKMSSFEKKFIFFSVFFFLISRCWLLFLGAYALDEPRVGDDSYIYMWKAKSQSISNLEEYPALKDIKSQFNLAKDTNEEVNLNRENVGVKVIGTYTPLSDFINGKILLIDSNFKIKWIFIELIVALFLVLSVTLFQVTIFGPVPASLSLLGLSVSVFPQHGMSYFMPSVLALSVGMLFWTYLINRKLESNLIIVLLLSFLMPFIHKIGSAYVLLGIPILGCVIDYKKILSVNFFRLSSTVIISLLFSHFIIYKYIPSPPEAKTILGFFGIGNFVLENIVSAFWQLSIFLKKSPLVFITFLFSLYFYKKFPTDALKIFCVFIAVAIISMFHFFIYPAELYSRIFVLIGIMISGFSGVAITKFTIDNHTLEHKKKFVYLFTYSMCLLLSLVLKFYPHSLDTIKYRLGSIDDIALSRQIEELHGKSFLYLEYSNAMQASLLAGAYKNHTLIYQMLGNSKKEIISTKMPQIIIAPNYRELNSVGIVRPVPVYPRKLGFSMRFSDYIELGFKNDLVEKSLSLMVDNREDWTSPTFVDVS